MAAKSKSTRGRKRRSARKIRSVNEQLVIASVRQHERTETAEKLNALLREEVAQRQRAEEALREREAWLRLLMDHVRDFAIFSLDREGRIKDWNVGAESLFGFTREEVVGQPVAILFTPDDRAAGIPQLEMADAEHTGYALDDRWHVDRNGRRLFLSGALRPLRASDGALVGFVKVAHDLTEREHAETLLRQSEAQLSGRAGQLELAVGERTAELTATNEQLETLVYSIAHHLRAPLRAVQGYASLLLQEAGEALSPTAQSYAQRINKSAQFLDAMLIDLLSFRTFSQRRLVLSPVKLEGVVAAIVSLLERDLQETGARVETLGPWPVVLAHRDVLGQVLFNLLSNALKFVAPGTRPQVRLWTEPGPPGTDHVRIWVEDNGIGIAPEHQPQLFSLFNRLHGEKYPGTGVGLSLVQKGVQRMGGRVGVQSAPGEGSRFWIELRQASSPSKDAPTPAGGGPDEQAAHAAPGGRRP